MNRWDLEQLMLSCLYFLMWYPGYCSLSNPSPGPCHSPSTETNVLHPLTNAKKNISLLKPFQSNTKNNPLSQYNVNHLRVKRLNRSSALVVRMPGQGLSTNSYQSV